ncbi:MAG: cytidine deaminase [Bacteroidales bacterium]
MKKEIKLHYLEFDDETQLSNVDALLLKQAQEAAQNAYAPYSKFKVGAAILLDNGQIVKGNNQENIAYPSGLCAERVALFAAKANYPTQTIQTLAICAIYADKILSSPIFPCGSCLQVLREYQKLSDHKIRILLQGMRGKVMIFEGVENLLPFGF